jgi:hypothetical protein
MIFKTAFTTFIGDYQIKQARIYGIEHWQPYYFQLSRYSSCIVVAMLKSQEHTRNDKINNNKDQSGEAWYWSYKFMSSKIAFTSRGIFISFRTGMNVLY